MRAFTVLVGVAILFPASFHDAFGQSQSTLNPRISAIGDVRALAGDATPDDLTFEFTELELGVQAHLNPFARGDIFIAFEEGAFQLEEGYASFTALPGGFGVRGGQYRVELGRFNKPHNHIFPFIRYPLFVKTYFSEEGYIDLGANPSLLVPIGSVPLTLSVDVLNGDFDPEHGHEEVEDDTTASEEDAPPRTLGDLAYNGRASVFFTLDRSTFFEVGGTVGTGVEDLAEDLRKTWYGVDAKFKYRPSRRTHFELAGEVLANRLSETGTGSETPIGAFAYANIQFFRNWNLGALVDYAQLSEAEGDDQLGYGGFAGFSVFEESTVFRLLVRNDDLPENQGTETSVVFQLLFGLGPHTPHSF